MKKLLSILLILSALPFMACNDDDDNNSVATLNDAVKNYVEKNYPGATITGVEKDANGLTDVDIVHDSKKKDVYFNQNGEWVYTEWDVAVAELPQVALENIKTSYPDYNIEDADYIQSPSGDFYLVDIERGNFEKNLKVSLDGATIAEL